MASNDDSKKTAKPAPPKNERLAQLQARANAARTRPPVSPQQFFQEAWVELKKTSWPSRDVLVKSTSVVLAFVISVAVWVGLLQLGLGKIFGFVINGR
jgi:preprotein translocase SecE subunit